MNDSGAHDLARDVLAAMVRDALKPFAGRVTITIDEAASLLGVSRSTAFEAAHRGEIETWRFGRRLVVPVPALAARLLATRADDAVSLLERIGAARSNESPGVTRTDRHDDATR